MKKRTTRKTIKFLAAASLFLGVTGVYWTLNSSKERKHIAESFVRGMKSESFSGQIQSRNTLGSLTRTELDLQSIGSFRFGESSDVKAALIDQNVKSTFKAELEEIVFADDGIEVKSYIVPSKMQIGLWVNEQDAGPMKDEIVRDLSQGFVLVRERSGIIRNIIMPKSAKDYSSDFAFTVAKGIQYSLPEGPLKSEWTSLEEDANGNYHARYKLTEQNGSKLNILREKTLYSKLSTSIEGTMGKNVLSSHTSGDIELGYDLEEQVIVSAKGQEKLVTLDDNGRPIGKSELSLQWTFRERTQLGPDKVLEFVRLTEEKFAGQAGYHEQRAEAEARQLRAMYEQRLGNDNLETILTAIDAAAAMEDKEASTQRMTELFLKSRALVYLHPEELPRIQDLLKNSPVESPFFQTMTSALVNISSVEAQKVLVDLTLARKDEPKAMESLIVDLGFVQNPEVIVEEALRTLQKDEATRGQADLSLATLGSQLQKTERPDAHERVKMIAEDIHSGMQTDDIEELKHRLDRVGNLSSSESYPHIREALKHEESEVRALAAFALRDIGTSEAESTLKSLLLSDKDDDVRIQAATALQNVKTSNELLDFQSEALSKEKNERVRIQLLLAINKAKYLAKDTVKNILETSSQQDPNEQVRNYASLLLTDFAAH